MQPDGFALLNLKEFLPKKEKIPTGKCGDIPYTDPLDSIQSIFIEPDGKVAVCNDFYIGNARKRDVLKIIEEYDPYKIIEMKSIIENGMIGLAEWARKRELIQIQMDITPFVICVQIFEKGEEYEIITIKIQSDCFEKIIIIGISFYEAESFCE